MSTNGVNQAFLNGLKVKLGSHGKKSSGITFELKSVFDEMAKKGLIKDTDGKGLSKQDAANLYAELNKMHEATNRDTNYAKMKVGQEFDYTADEMKALAKAAGYEIVEPESEETKPKTEVTSENQAQPGNENQVSPDGGHIEDEHDTLAKAGDGVKNLLLGEGNGELVTAHEPMILTNITGPSNAPEYEMARLANVPEDFNADGQVGKTDGHNYYINGVQVSKEAYDVAKAKAESGAGDGVKNLLLGEGDGVLVTAHEPMIMTNITGPSNDPKYEMARLANVPEDFNADGQVGKTDGHNYYINGVQVSKEAYDVAKAKALAKNEPPKTYTQEEIDAKIASLQPGEEFRYQYNSSYDYGFMKGSQSYPVTWRRNEDGTLTKTEQRIMRFGPHAIDIKQVPFNKHIDANGRVIAEDFLSRNTKLKGTRYFDEQGNAVKEVVDLSLVDNTEYKFDSVLTLVNYSMNKGFDGNKPTSAEVTDSNGNVKFTYKNGKYYNSIGIKIPQNMVENYMQNHNGLSIVARFDT